MPMLRRLSVALFSVALLVMWMVWPVSSHAQAVKAGVISTVSGKVTAIRAGLAQPLPLKFKDDVFLQDRIATGEQSLARVLLGGKALVTIRELSVLTITEVPGQATINLESGKVGLAVARDRMRPGESIEVRTPNAVAAVRGTVLITETDRVEGRLPRTAMYLTSDPSGRGVGVTHLNPATGLPIGLPTTLAENLGFFATGAAPLSVRQMTAADQARARAGLEDYVPPHLQAANQAHVSQVQLREATELANTLNQQPPPTMALAGALSSQNAVEQAQEEQNSTSAIGVFVTAATEAITSAITSPPPSTLASTGCSSPPCAGLSGNPSLFFSTNLPSVTLSPSVLSPSSFPASSSTTPGAPATPFGAGALTNGSFESALTGWTITGAASFLGAFGPFTPSGSLMAIIHTESPALGLGVSTLSQSFTLASTTLTKLKLSYNFLTNEFPTQSVNDFFRAKLISPTAVETILAFESRLGSAFTSTTSSITAAGFTLLSGKGYTGFINLSIPLMLTPGTWTLFFEVRNVSDSAFDSAALIDVVQAVPDPPLHFLWDGGTMTRTDPVPLLHLVSSPQTFDALLVVCCDSTAAFAGTLLHATDSDLDVPFSLVTLLSGGTLVTSSTDPLALIERGRHTLGASDGVFSISGVHTALDPETGLVLGTDRPLQHAGVLLEASDAIIATDTVVRLDTALLEASLPVLNLTNRSSLTTQNAAADLSYRAKVTSLGPLMRLDNSNLTVNQGALANVAGGSVLSVAGDLISLLNGSTLSLLNGPLLSLSGGSVASISGGLVAFGGSGGNALKVTNSLCSPCSLFGGIPVALTNGAVASNVSIGGSPIKNPALGSVTLSNPTLGSGGTALAVLSGAASKLTVGGK